MDLAKSDNRLQLPESLQTQLLDYRRRVWTIKATEAACGAMVGILVSYLLVFAFDRVWETPLSVRIATFVVAVLACEFVPVYLHRWIWSHRRLEQLARLLSRKYPHLGDQLLGIIELVQNPAEQKRSTALCEAAIQQVSQESLKRNLGESVSTSRRRVWGWSAAFVTAAAVALLAIFPAAATNAWARFAMPWQDTPRYTFAFVEQLPERLVVAHGEPVTIPVRLLEDTRWSPAEGVVQLGSQQPVTAGLKDGVYPFSLPSQIDAAWLHLHIGDAIQNVRVEPMLRPELTTIMADVALPDYLGRPERQKKDVRGGAISLLKGSRATFAATASRKLSHAKIDGKQYTPAAETVTSSEMKVDASRKLEIEWQDEFGLAGKAPFTLALTGRDDEAPSLSCEDLPRQKVVLDTETLSFKIRAVDDFGIKSIGMEWQGIDPSGLAKPSKGERVLAAGGNAKDILESSGTFTAQSLGIDPQPVSLRLYTEDYFPGRPRVYSTAYTFYVLNAEQHSIWLTEQLSKWHRQSLEVRDREMQLHQANKQLRELTPDQLEQPETRRRIENQAAAERANGRPLNGLVASGDDLVRQAMRNPEFGVGHLEKWAEMLQILKDIAGNRMPSVADLLKQAAEAPTVASSTPASKSKMAGQDRSSSKGAAAKELASPPKPPSAVPQIVDRESSQQPAKKGAEPQEGSKSKSQPRLTLPVTTIAGNALPKPSTPTEKKMDEAIVKQRDLLAEFDKIAEELNRVLANLEGSTLVKRLKAASRHQYRIGGKINDQLGDTFGVALTRVAAAPSKVLDELAGQETKGSHDVSLIMDDLQAYFERRQFQQFKTVLDEMKHQDPVGSLRQLGDDIRKQNGISIAQSEYWSDTFDRWADDLVDPACCGKCPGCKSKGSLPPSVVLEVLQVLEAEVHLREDTRVAEQAKAALAAEQYTKEAEKLSGTQDKLRTRIENVTEVIRKLEDGETEFAKEIQLLEMVTAVMREATEILARPETGSPAIAAETEVIELLLKSKRINPNGGGGGGASPGGGGGGTTQDSALALIGRGANEKEVREDHGVSQSTGDAGQSLPDEFRAGLDEYFNRLEGKKAK